MNDQMIRSNVATGTSVRSALQIGKRNPRKPFLGKPVVPPQNCMAAADTVVEICLNSNGENCPALWNPVFAACLKLEEIS